MLFKLRKISHTQVQAEFYKRCCEEGIPISLEYTHQNCRFDAVIHDHAHVRTIVEIKSYSKRRKPNYNTKQYKKYSQYGLPVLIITGVHDIEKTITEIKVSWFTSSNLNKTQDHE